MSTVRSLHDLGLTDAAEVGGKAASLGDLVASGIRVPEGIVVTVAGAGLSVNERRGLIEAAVRGLGPGPFAVRSSGVAEDGSDRSFAGMYETALDVERADVAAAAERVLASASSARVAGYVPNGDGRLAVLIQRMVSPVAAGVALTADPISGDRSTCVVTAVRGTGDRLVSGQSVGDEWTVRDGTAVARRTVEAAIERSQALRVAEEAVRIATSRGTPQDVEWAIDANGEVWILQARPMTALPPDVSWEAPAPGAYTRMLRLGEWIGEPVTPLFESWLLTAMEDRMHAVFREEIGQVAPRPYHVVVNGWYFYSINFVSPRALLRSLPGMLRSLVRNPRALAGVIPPTVRHSVPGSERWWREVRPRYRSAVADAEDRVESMPLAELPQLVDRLGTLAGEYFALIAALGGAAYKLEMNLAQFYRKHLQRQLGGSHLPLLSGFGVAEDPSAGRIVSLDWWHAPLPRDDAAAHANTTVIEARHAAESAARAALAASPRRLRAFERLLADAQHVVPIREEQTSELTIAWPVMRRAVERIGEALAATDVIAAPDDVFFLTRAEVVAAVAGDPMQVDVSARRDAHREQARLVPPPIVGRANPLMQRVWDSFPGLIGAVPSPTALVSGIPASAGRARGRVRVIRGPQEFDELQPGEVLVAPLTAPAWTPLFRLAAGVVTDVGSPASHASIIAREYGIPAVVGCGDATARLRTGMQVTVDGITGNVEPE
jgi:pyruvate,water dikinase